MSLPRSRTCPISFAWLIPIVLLAAAVRFYHLGTDDLWSDEAFSVVSSLGPPGDLLRLLASAEPHPPLYPYLLAGWLRVFGSSEFVARLPSAFFGVASVPVAAAIARGFAPPDDRRRATLAAVVAALLVAANPFQVWYSQEARMYAQVSFFSGLATLALLGLRRGRRGGIALYAAAVVGAAGSHYYGLFIPLAHGLALLGDARRDRPVIVRWLKAMGIAVAAYLPWTYVALRVFTSYYGGPPGSENLPQIALSAWVRLASSWALTWQEAIALAGLASAVALSGLVAPARGPTDRFLRLVLVFWLATPFVGGYLVSLARPLYNERYLIVSSLPLILLMSRGISWLLTPTRGRAPVWRAAAREGRRLGGYVVLVAVLAAAYIPLRNVWAGEYVQSTYNTHVRTIDLLAQNDDAVILDGPAQEPLYRYYARRPLPFVTVPRRMPLNPADVDAALGEVASSHPGAWVVRYAADQYDPTNVIGRWLDQHGYLSFDMYNGNARLQYYRFAPELAASARPTAIRFGNALELQGYAGGDETIPSGGTVAVDLRWQRLAAAPAHPRVALRLVDSRGVTWAQTDEDVASPTDGSPGDDHHGLLAPAGTPPGTYALLLNAYAAGDAQPFSPSGEGAPIEPGGVRLGAVRVDRPARAAWTAGIAGFRPLSVGFPGGLQLLGYAGADAATAGQGSALLLFWKATKPAPPANQLRLVLQAPDGKVVEGRDVPLATDEFPTARWQAGDVVSEQYRLPIDAKLPGGDYRLKIQPLPAVGTPTSTVGAEAALGTLAIRPGPPPISAAPPSHRLASTLGGVIALSGFDLASAQLRPGDQLDLTLHWDDLAPADADYTVFVHVLDSSEKVVAQRDQPPAAGARPTSSWFPDDAILDRYTIPLPVTLPSGDYAIEVGMYNPTDGTRLPVETGGQPAGDRIVIAMINVKQ